MEHTYIGPRPLPPEALVAEELLRDYLKYLPFSEQDNAAGLGRVTALMITGEPGSGRHTFLRALAGSFRDRGCRLFCARVTGDGAPDPECIAALPAAMQEEDCLLILRSAEDIRDAEALERLMEEAEASGHGLCIAAAVYAPERMAPEVSALFHRIFLEKPPTALRRKYVTEKLRDLNLSAYAREQLVSGTQGFGYGELESLAFALRLSMKKLSAGGFLQREDAESRKDAAVTFLLQNAARFHEKEPPAPAPAVTPAPAPDPESIPAVTPKLEPLPLNRLPRL